MTLPQGLNKPPKRGGLNLSDTVEIPRWRMCQCKKKYPAGSPSFGFDYCRGCGHLMDTDGTSR